MTARTLRMAAGAVVLSVGLCAWALSGAAQTPAHAGHGAAEPDHPGHDDHRMYVHTFASGWTVGGMAQLVPLGSTLRGAAGTPLSGTDWVLTQNAAMINLESPERGWSVRFTPHFEALTLQDGEITPGGWGEGFLDSRHPHTLIHELMVSRVWRNPNGWSAHLSAGKGFAAYGSDDPMSRPVVKYPTNHHLAQILERYTVNGALARGGWTLEGSVFGGDEPEGPFDMGNYRNFGNSFSGRVTHGAEVGGGALELSASVARIVEEHGGNEQKTTLFHAGTRWEGEGAYLLMEGAVSRVDEAHPVDGYWSVLAEGGHRFGPIRAYLRGELAARPEYPRESGDSGFFRYEHDDIPEGATRWRIGVVGIESAGVWAGTVLFRPFVEGARYRAERVDGVVDPRFPLEQGFGSLTFGVRIFPGGGPMRMGGYGLRDAMSRMLTPAPEEDHGGAIHHEHH